MNKPFNVVRQDGTGRSEHEGPQSACDAARALAAKKPGVGVIVTHAPSGSVVFDTVAPVSADKDGSLRQPKASRPKSPQKKKHSR